MVAGQANEWLDTCSPTLAILSVADKKELTQRLAELRELEGTVGAKLPVLVASPGASVRLSPQEAENRPWATVPIPGRYQVVVKAVVDLSAAIAGGARSGGGRTPNAIAPVLQTLGGTLTHGGIDDG